MKTLCAMNRYFCRHYYLAVLGPILAAGLFLRLFYLDSPLHYDEIWGIFRWMPQSNWKILSTLNNMNNHPLNSVLMKYSRMIFGADYIYLRIPNLIAGCVTPIAVSVIAWQLWHNRAVTALTLTFCCLQAGLVCYSHTARGYSLQTAAITVFAMLIVLYYKNGLKYSGRTKWLLAILLLCCFVFACMSLATAIMFLAPIMLIHAWLMLRGQFNRGKSLFKLASGLLFKHKEIVVGYAAITSFAIIVYIVNYRQLSSAVPAGAGAQMTSLHIFFAFIKRMAYGLLPWAGWLLALGCFFRRKYRYAGILLLFIMVFPVGAGIVIKGGPARAYLPLAPFVAIAAAAGSWVIVSQFRFFRRSRYIVVLVMALLLLANFPGRYAIWKQIDWQAVIAETNRLLSDKACYKCYPACESLRVAASMPEERRNLYKNISDGMFFVQMNGNGTLNGITRLGGEANMKYVSTHPPATLRVSGIPVQIYRIRKLTEQNQPDSNIILANILPMPKRMAKSVLRQLYKSGGAWLVLNWWLCSPLVSARGDSRLYSYQAICGDSQLSTKKMLQVEKRSGGQVRFFYLSGKFEKRPEK